ncbi:1-acyl-sn-glycerol-3-phosphate acyltransferase [Thermoleophilia bacterium SCSIO 60948]|nr:1-acyl-sn-glycerol-3-phosphate acyltransferase [Thermoleophilia bacterium SCSIO 60948]
MARSAEPRIKPSVYKDPRPAAEMERFHAWIREHPPGWIYGLVRLILTPIALLIYRTRAIDTANVPGEEGFILAPNHFSNMDHFFAGVCIRRKIQFMAKSQLYGKSRVLDYVFRVGGVFPVRRGHRDEESFATAYAILERGGCVGMYAEGGRSRTGGLGSPKPGLGRMALESGAPVVPCAIHGSSGVRGWKRMRFPKVTVRFGEPIVFDRVERADREASMAASRQIFDSVKAMYAELDEHGRREVARSAREAHGLTGARPAS